MSKTKLFIEVKELYDNHKIITGAQLTELIKEGVEIDLSFYYDHDIKGRKPKWSEDSKVEVVGIDICDGKTIEVNLMIDCEDCENCLDMIRCKGCKNCSGCIDCTNCDNSVDCSGLVNRSNYSNNVEVF